MIDTEVKVRQTGQTGVNIVTESTDPCDTLLSSPLSKDLHLAFPEEISDMEFVSQLTARTAITYTELRPESGVLTQTVSDCLGMPAGAEKCNLYQI